MKRNILLIGGAVISLIITGTITYKLTQPDIPASPPIAEDPAQTSVKEPTPALTNEPQTEQMTEIAEAPAPALAPVPSPPKVPAIPTGERMLEGGLPQSFYLAVASPSPEVSELVLMGMHYLFSNREDAAGEAFREAATADPSCALAQWGLFVSIAPGAEQDQVSQAALENIRKLARDASLPDRERAYLLGAITLADEGAFAAGEVFHNLTGRWKADLPARLAAALMLHDRYDELGNPIGGQAKAIELLDDALVTNPENHALLFTRALMEETAPVISPVAMEASKKVVQLAPEHASSWHLRGHILFRSGDYAAAAAAYARAHKAFDKTRDPLNPSLAMDECWIKALLCESVALYCEGKQDKGFREAVGISLLPQDETRPKSSGTLILKWEAATLSARMTLDSVNPAILNKGLATLPVAANASSSEKDEPHLLLYKALNRYFKARLNLQKDPLRAGKLLVYFEDVQKHYLASQSAAMAGGAISYWTRGRQLLEILSMDLKARIFPESASFRWEDAADTQSHSSLLLPPLLPFPVEYLAAKNILKTDSHRGKESQLSLIEKGLARFPNHAGLLSLKSEADGGGGARITIEPVSETAVPGFSSSEKPKKQTAKPKPARTSRNNTSAKKKRR